MKKIAVFMSLILIFNLLLFVPVSAEQQIIAEPSVAAGYNHVLGLNQYGRVFSAGDNTYGQCDTFHWKGITQVCAGKTFSAGLKEDGAVVIAGEISEETSISADELSGIVQISAGNNFLAARDESGNVHIVGDAGNIDTASWENIEKIACGSNHVVALKDSTVIGSDYNNGDMSLGFEDVLVEDVYAGEGLTVVKDNMGKLYHYGNGTYIAGSSEEGSKWTCSEWEDISTLDIQQGSGMNAIVIAVNNSGEVLTDGMELNHTIGWTPAFLQKLQNMANVKSLVVHFYKNHNYAIAVKEDNEIECITDNSDVIYDRFMEELERFDLKIKPISFEKVGIDVVPSDQTVGILLPNGDVCTIGPTKLSGFEKIKALKATLYKDYFLGVSNIGNIYTNLPEDDIAITIMEDWKGVEKIATWRWDNEEKLITALRWDGCVYSTYDKALIENYENVTDIAGGYYYMAALINNKVKFYIQNTSLKNYFDSSKLSGDIDKIFTGYSHMVARSQSNGWEGTGKNDYGECNVSEWDYNMNVSCGQNFTVGVDSDGECYYAGREDLDSYKAFKNEIENWSNLEEKQKVNRFFAADDYVVAYKDDGTFDFATKSTKLGEIESQLKNTYYKDNTFYTFKVEENIATVEYYSDEDIEVYFSYFDEEGRPIGFEKEVLSAVDSLTKVELKNEKSHSFTISVGEPTADKMKFYMEQEAVGDTVKITHCAQEGQRIMLAFYDDEDNMLDIKVRTLGEINNMTEASFSCANATKYKLFIRDGALPLYKAEGTLN